MTTLDEAIKHAEEVADTCEYAASKYDMSDPYESHVACQEGKCAEEHRQLAEWLKELKEYRTQIFKIDDIREETYKRAVLNCMSMIDAIRAEIETEMTHNLSNEQTQAFSYVLWLIDKYTKGGE